jgi:dTDP-4-amino-4,6-dideoxy-D-galactose acyltransferase
LRLAPLEWDSAFFGLRLARLTGETLDAGVAAEAIATGREQRQDCLVLLLSASNAPSIRAAEDAGFRLVDSRLTLERPAGLPPPPRPGGISVRAHRPEDVAALEAIAAEAHQGTRFWRDGRFPAERAAELYRTWIRQECRGGADRVLLAEEQGSPTGYLSCHREAGGGARIGLLGVRSDARGRGVGAALLAAALTWFAEGGSPAVGVVTQGHGIAAQRLYQRAGFLTVRMDLWFHRWLT